VSPKYAESYSAPWRIFVIFVKALKSMLVRRNYLKLVEIISVQVSLISYKSNEKEIKDEILVFWLLKSKENECFPER
jgi:hypothetical protein